ncbi:MAG: c-type cytochrome biogenesis protein CcmI [Zoogloeaceae bacterium]|jgi:cytochrome c-type biogenesis protein CcmH|nr:c-type cytochrome biogenesis protein CcmI [Zoogloeaceae bacterium]
MIPFLLAALVLTALVVALLLPALLRPSRLPSIAPADHAAAILREQLDELKTEQAAGKLTATEFAEAEDELKRRLLEEHQESARPSQPTKPATKTAIVLTLMLVVGGFALYGLLGNLLALQPELAQSAARQAEAGMNAGQQMTPEQITRMVEGLAARLEKNPDDPEGWLMLARSYKMLNRPADAATAYARIEPVVARDASLLADYAEALAMSSATRLNGKPRQLVAEALQLEPENPRALFLAGMAALEAGEKPEAIKYWEKLLPHVEAGSELHQLLTEQLAKLRNP